MLGTERGAKENRTLHTNLARIGRHLGTCDPIFSCCELLRGLEPRSTLYKSAALPDELQKHVVGV